MAYDIDLSHQGSLSIGAVAKLTGISVHTLRAWEKRHNVVEVLRSTTGRRLYRSEDVVRLRLLRRLTSSGHSIGNIASMPNEALENLLSLDKEVPQSEPKRSVEVCIYSDKALVDTHISPNLNQQVKVVLSTTDTSPLREKLETLKSVSVAVILTTVQKNQLHIIRQLIEKYPRHSFFLVFTFAQREIIEELNELGIVLLRSPISFEHLMQKIVDTQMLRTHREQGQVPLSYAEEVPPHRYSKKQLDYMATIHTAIDCECPKHISELINSLTKFESYCQHCAIHNKEDAYLHNDIYKLTAQSRHLMERAVALVMEAEKINIENISSEN